MSDYGSSTVDEENSNSDENSDDSMLIIELMKNKPSVLIQDTKFIEFYFNSSISVNDVIDKTFGSFLM